jgi:DNA-binding transcriptional MerR regulator
MQTTIKKLYHSITEAAAFIGEEQHVLRYWEREFPQLRPQKNRAGNRVYTQRDLAVLLVIKQLLREKRYTVAGAREHLKTAGLPDEVVAIPLAAVEDQGQQQQQPADVPHERAVDQERAMGVLRELRSLAADLRAKTTVA